MGRTFHFERSFIEYASKKSLSIHLQYFCKTPHFRGSMPFIQDMKIIIIFKLNFGAGITPAQNNRIY